MVHESSAGRSKNVSGDSRLRMDSITGEPGLEGLPLPGPKSHSGVCIGVFTSGGDSQGIDSTFY